MDDFQAEEEQTTFVVEEVSKIVKESVEATIGGNTYQHNRVNQWTTSVVEQCLSQLSKLGKSFKYIVTCVIMQKTELACKQLMLVFGITRLMVTKIGEVSCILFLRITQYYNTFVLNRKLCSEMGKQVNVLHRHCFWTSHLILQAVFDPFSSVLPKC
uniref:Dynein, light chain, Tctex-type 1 n=1 Tax=Neogobius melanostomus TaxID=47308 RepID=A0A8C6UNI2_9GOBI